MIEGTNNTNVTPFFLNGPNMTLVQMKKISEHIKLCRGKSFFVLGFELCLF